MHYIINTKSVPPEFIWNDPEIRDKDGNTLGMLWMIHLHKEPPEKLWHDLNIRNTNNDSFLELWARYIKTEIPYKLTQMMDESKKKEFITHVTASTEVSLELMQEVITDVYNDSGKYKYPFVGEQKYVSVLMEIMVNNAQKYSLIYQTIAKNIRNAQNATNLDDVRNALIRCVLSCIIESGTPCNELIDWCCEMYGLKPSVSGKWPPGKHLLYPGLLKYYVKFGYNDILEKKYEEGTSDHINAYGFNIETIERIIGMNVSKQYTLRMLHYISTLGYIDGRDSQGRTPLMLYMMYTHEVPDKIDIAREQILFNFQYDNEKHTTQWYFDKYVLLG